MAYERMNLQDNVDKWTAANIKHLEDAIINLENQNPSFYTELARVSSKDQKLLTVICKGLTVGETYDVHLYTAARRRGSQHDPWRHPSNENTGKGYTGKGYANLAGQYYAGYVNGEVYPPVPDWMPNNGILQTEWSFTAGAETEKLDIDYSEWLLPMLKPNPGDFSRGTYGLIGVYSAAAPLLMQFRLVHRGIVGNCYNTFCVGVPRDNKGYISLDSLNHIKNLYTSIK